MTSNLRKYLSVLFVLCVCAVLLPAEKDSKEAKKLYEQAKKETDPARQVQEMCAAANLEKKYQKECDTLLMPFVARQIARIGLAEDALTSRRDFKAARELANGVVAITDDLVTRKSALLTRIDNAERASKERKPPAVVDHSSEYLARMESDFERGDFAAATTDAQGITDPAMKATAQHHLADIARYNGLVVQAQTLEQHGDLAGAVNAYQAAQQICANGPGNTAAQIGRLQEKLSHHGSPKPQPNPKIDEAQVVSLLSSAHQAENQQQWKQAQDQYNAVLKLDASNKEANAGLQRIQPKLAALPNEKESILRTAIRAYYASSFESAKTSLKIYLNEQQIQNRGTADFYLGATLLEQAIFQSKSGSPADLPPDAANAFKRAHQEGYKPLPQYISPIVLKAWNGSGLLSFGRP